MFVLKGRETKKEAETVRLIFHHCSIPQGPSAAGAASCQSMGTHSRSPTRCQGCSYLSLTCYLPGCALAGSCSGVETLGIQIWDMEHKHSMWCAKCSALLVSGLRCSWLILCFVSPGQQPILSPRSPAFFSEKLQNLPVRTLRLCTVHWFYTSLFIDFHPFRDAALFVMSYDF